MSNLRKEVIKLAHEAGPGELRDKLTPLIKEGISDEEAQSGAIQKRMATAHAMCWVLHSVLQDMLPLGEHIPRQSTLKLQNDAVRMGKVLWEKIDSQGRSWAKRYRGKIESALR